MQVLEVVIGELEGATVFFVLDWFRGYWQLPLHPDSQEYYTIITHRGMYTPTWVPMRATDPVAYCQGVVEEVFGDLIGNGVLVWLDDTLGVRGHGGEPAHAPRPSPRPVREVRPEAACQEVPLLLS